MSSNLVNLINQYTQKYINRVTELENEIKTLKTQPSNNEDYQKLKKEYDSLMERHKEIKFSYTELDRDFRQLQKEIDRLKNIIDGYRKEEETIRTIIGSEIGDAPVFSQPSTPEFKTHSLTEPISSPKSNNNFSTPKSQSTSSKLDKAPNAPKKSKWFDIDEDYESESNYSDSDDEKEAKKKSDEKVLDDSINALKDIFSNFVNQQMKSSSTEKTTQQTNQPFDFAFVPSTTKTPVTPRKENSNFLFSQPSMFEFPPTRPVTPPKTPTRQNTDKTIFLPKVKSEDKPTDAELVQMILDSFLNNQQKQTK